MILFTSDHHHPGREYRVTSWGEPSQLVEVEHFARGEWRRTRNITTRGIAHVLVHGAPHQAVIDELARARVVWLAEACAVSSGSEHAGQESDQS